MVDRRDLGRHLRHYLLSVLSVLSVLSKYVRRDDTEPAHLASPRYAICTILLRSTSCGSLLPMSSLVPLLDKLRRNRRSRLLYGLPDQALSSVVFDGLDTWGEGGGIMMPPPPPGWPTLKRTLCACLSGQWSSGLHTCLPPLPFGGFC